MYTYNSKLGIGQVLEVKENTVVVFFSEVEETKELLKKFVKIYETEEDAEDEINNIDYDAVLLNIEKEKKEAEDRKKVILNGLNIIEENNKKLINNLY